MVDSTTGRVRNAVGRTRPAQGRADRNVQYSGEAGIPAPALAG